MSQQVKLNWPRNNIQVHKEDKEKTPLEKSLNAPSMLSDRYTWIAARPLNEIMKGSRYGWIAEQDIILFR